MKEVYNLGYEEGYGEGYGEGYKKGLQVGSNSASKLDEKKERSNLLSASEVAPSIEGMAKSFNNSMKHRNQIDKTWDEWMRAFANYVQCVARERRKGFPE